MSETDTSAAPGACLNCKSPLGGAYCSSCGQAAAVHRSLKGFGHYILHSVLHFDGKFWRTLPLLAWAPGTLTRRYIHGERARFVSPVALFLFAVFTLFATFAIVNDLFATSIEPAAIDTALAKQRQQSLEMIAAAREKLENDNISAEERATLAQTLRDWEAWQRGLNTVSGDNAGDESGNESGNISGKGAAATSGSDVDVATDGTINTGLKWLDKRMHEGFKKAKTNPNLLIYKVKTNGYKFAWALIPISLPLIWLVMIGRGEYHLYDHAVFVTYSIAFMICLLVALVIASALGLSSSFIGWVVTLYPPIHLYRHLRGTYQLSRFETIIRLMFLAIAIVIAVALFLSLLFAMGVLG